MGRGGSGRRTCVDELELELILLCFVCVLQVVLEKLPDYAEDVADWRSNFTPQDWNPEVCIAHIQQDPRLPLSDAHTALASLLSLTALL